MAESRKYIPAITSVFDYDRALNALLYVSNRLESNKRDIHKIFKILYFADMSHLCKYGRAITGDTYIAMKYGPVPSCIYDMVKVVRGDSLYNQPELKAFFTIKGNMLEPLRSEDLDYLSESDVRELGESVAKYGNLTFDKMTEISHDNAWEKAYSNPISEKISVVDILTENGANEDYINYIVENLSAQKELCK